MDAIILGKVNTWLSGKFDNETKDAIRKMQAENDCTGYEAPL